jgi:hypothetical protein
MDNAVAAYFPFLGGDEMVYYYPSRMERYLPVSPGIEVSVEAYAESRKEDGGLGTVLYDGRGKLTPASRKGNIVDTRL